MSSPRPRASYVASESIRAARTCRDHLAGRLGIAVADALLDDGDLRDDAEQRLSALGLDVDRLRSERRPFVRLCTDWTERRPHVAGAVGGALASRLFALGWIERVDETRAVRLTEAGSKGLRERLQARV
ncbi:MAG TPA: hypothetical protein VF101_02850 [Gaiellaceae bacterium]